MIYTLFYCWEEEKKFDLIYTPQILALPGLGKKGGEYGQPDKFSLGSLFLMG